MAKHLNTELFVDSGRSAWAWWQAPKHAAPMTEWEYVPLVEYHDGDNVVCAHPSKYNDAWSGNPDTDKYWSK